MASTIYKMYFDKVVDMYALKIMTSVFAMYATNESRPREMNPLWDTSGDFYSKY
jgi:hypothetical protein